MLRLFSIVDHLTNSVDGLSVVPCSQIDDEVVINEYSSAIGIILNRPKALNSVNLNMINLIQHALDNAKKTNKKLIVIKGAGERAFCAGGDIRALAESAKVKNYSYCAEFFSKEFNLDCQIAELKEDSSLNYISLLNGITMGGGVGLSVHSKFVIATESVKFAMPETGIGFFCDVGGSYFLSRLPGRIGEYIALTGYRLNIKDLMYCGIVTHYCPSSYLTTLEEELLSSDGSEKSILTILSNLSKFQKPRVESILQNRRNNIDTCFSGRTIQEIYNSLEKLNNSWTKDTIQTLKLKSPTSLALELECIRKGRLLNIRDVVKMEFGVAMRCMQHNDFYEGVRALIIDKDNKPNWIPNSIEGVKSKDIEHFFIKDPEFKKYEL